MRDAVVFPGGFYGPHQPMLYYASRAVEARGGEYHPVDWPEPVYPTIFDEAKHHGFVDPVASRALDAAGGRPLVIGKSHVLEVEGADHGMMVPGPLSASAAVLGRIADAVEQFLDELARTTRRS